jgi:hypothetical protein
VHFEADGAAVFSHQPRGQRISDTNPAMRERASLDCFLYHPREHEAVFRERRPGLTFGTASLLTAAMARHLTFPESYPLFIALGRGFAAARANHEIGGGSTKFSPDAAFERLKMIFSPQGDEEPAAVFSSAFRHDIVTDPRKSSDQRSDLLHDTAGFTIEYVAAKATEVILYGADKALRNVPMASYGKYLTADREEIEQKSTPFGISLPFTDQISMIVNPYPLRFSVHRDRGSRSLSSNSLRSSSGLQRQPWSSTYHNSRTARNSM